MQKSRGFLIFLAKFVIFLDVRIFAGEKNIAVEMLKEHPCFDGGVL